MARARCRSHRRQVQQTSVRQRVLIAVAIALLAFGGSLARAPSATAVDDPIAAAIAHKRALQDRITKQQAEVEGLAEEQEQLKAQVEQTTDDLAAVNIDLGAVRTDLAARTPAGRRKAGGRPRYRAGPPPGGAGQAREVGGRDRAAPGAGAEASPGDGEVQGPGEGAPRKQQANEKALTARIRKLIEEERHRIRLPSKYNGIMRWPVKGTVTNFGCTGIEWEPPSEDCEHFHKGLDLVGETEGLPSTLPLTASSCSWGPAPTTRQTTRLGS